MTRDSIGFMIKIEVERVSWEKAILELRLTTEKKKNKSVKTRIVPEKKTSSTNEKLKTRHLYLEK